MRGRKTTELIVEIEEPRAVRTRRRAPVPLERRWCASCAAFVGMLAPDDAAHDAGVSAHAIRHMIEAGALHSVETEGGGLLVCLASVKMSGDAARA